MRARPIRIVERPASAWAVCPGGQQAELVAIQEWAKATGAKICIVFEGGDTAGQGGTIKRIVERVSPRVFHVVALPTPTDREKSQM
jgi:polyphosphate kinase